MRKDKLPAIILDSIEKKLKIGIIVLSPRLEIDYINTPARELFQPGTGGENASTLAGLLSKAPDLFKQILIQMEVIDGRSVEIMFVDPASRKEYQVWISPTREKDEELSGWVIQFMDISQQRRVENDLESTKGSVTTLLDTLNDFYFETDITGVITNINLAFAQQLGFPRKEEIIGKHLRHFTDRESVRLVYQNYRKVFEERETVKLFQYTYHTRDGREFIGETTVSPIIQDDNVTGARGFLRDVTERVRAEEDLQKTSRDLEARVNELAVINRISVLMSESLNLKQVLHALCEEFTRIFPIRNAGIGIITPDKEFLEVVAFHSDILEEESLEGMFLPLPGNSAFEEVVKTMKALWIPDAGSDPRMGSVAGVAAQRGTKSLMIAPLLSRGTAIGTIFLPGKDPEHVFTEKELELAGTIANQIATAIDNAQLFEKIETALDSAQHDLQIGKAIQSGFFPDNIPVIPGWEISTYFQPARYVSGDFYDIYPLGDSKYTAFIIGDVCDKGVGAALFMALFRSLFRAFSRNVDTSGEISRVLLDIVRNTNAYVAGIHGKASMFATVFMGIIDPEEGRIHYINGGHEPPVLLNKAGSIRNRLRPTGPAIGLFENAKYETGQIDLDPGDFLVGYTDGTLDAENAKGEAYSEGRFLNLIQAPWTSLFSMVFELRNEINKHAGEQKQFDDIALLAVRRRGDPIIERHGICRLAEMEILDDLTNFVEAAAVESQLTHAEAILLREATELTCSNLIRSVHSQGKPGVLSMFFERESEKVSIILRDDSIHLGEEVMDSIEAELKARNPQPASRVPVLVFDTLTHEVMDKGGNKLALKYTRIPGEN